MLPYEALSILKDEIKEKYELDNEYYKYKILKLFDIKYSIQEKGNQAKAKVEQMKLYRAKPLEYNFINEDVNILNNKVNV